MKKAVRFTAGGCAALLAMAGCGGGSAAGGPAPGTGGGTAGGATPTPSAPIDGELPPKAQFHLYLLAGQSNMAGRGLVEAQDKRTHPRVLALNKQGRWVQAADPIHFDKKEAGVGPGRTFGLVLAEADPNITIGLIPAAVGGTAISSWQPGAVDAATGTRPYDDAIARTRRALESGTLKGILWHQGEGDTADADAAAYEDRLKVLISRFRFDLKAPDMPFLIGQLGRFAGARWTPGREKVDAAQQKVVQEVPFTAFVSSQGLTDKGDNLHFDAASARELGRRYAETYLRLFH